MNDLLDFLLAYRVAYETSFPEVLIPESKIVGVCRDLNLQIKRGKDVYKVAKKYRNFVQVVFSKGRRLYRIRDCYWWKLFELTNNMVRFEPFSLRIIRGKHIVGGLVIRLRGVYKVASVKWVSNFLFQTTLMSIKDGYHYEYIGHIRCLWRQCRKIGEELNFSSLRSLRGVFNTPHIKYLVWYLLANADGIPYKLHYLVDAILFFSQEIFGENNVSVQGDRLIITSLFGTLSICNRSNKNVFGELDAEV